MNIKKGARILLVEDKASLLEVFAAELRDAGYVVVEAASGVQAVLVLAEDFDLLLTDIRTSSCVNGWDLAEAARRIQPNIEVIYMTGYSEEPAERVDRSVFLTKPCTVRQILSLIGADS